MSKLLAVVVAFCKRVIFGRDTSNAMADIIFPGHVNFANKGGEYFHGSKAKFFFTLRGLNEWCMPGNEGENALVAEIAPTLFGYMLIYNRKLSRKDEDTVERFGREINAKIAQENQEHEAREAADREQRERDMLEEKRLAAIGKKYEERVGKIKGSAIGKERERLMDELNSGKLDE